MSTLAVDVRKAELEPVGKHLQHWRRTFSELSRGSLACPLFSLESPEPGVAGA